MTHSLHYDTLTSDEAKAQGLKFISSYLWPEDASMMIAEIQRLKELGKPVAVAEKRLCDGSLYKHLFTTPAVEKLNASLHEQRAKVKSMAHVRVTKKKAI